MSRSKFILVLALLLLLAVPIGFFAQTPELISAQTPEGTGTAVIFDDQALSDGIIFTMAGVHYGWKGRKGYILCWCSVQDPEEVKREKQQEEEEEHFLQRA